MEGRELLIVIGIEFWVEEEILEIQSRITIKRGRSHFYCKVDGLELELELELEPGRDPEIYEIVDELSSVFCVELPMSGIKYWLGFALVEGM